jgi:hypothetical protein
MAIVSRKVPIWLLRLAISPRERRKEALVLFGQFRAGFHPSEKGDKMLPNKSPEAIRLAVMPAAVQPSRQPALLPRL